MEPPSSAKHRGSPDPAPQISIRSEQSWPLDFALIEGAIRATFHSLRITAATVDVLLCRDDTIRDLNRRFRQIDEATDVLTFPSGDGHSGDLAICVPYADRQGQLRGASVQDEVLFLAIHGALHLAGFDDDTPEDQADMVRRMNEIAQSLGLDRDDEWWSRGHAQEAFS